METIDEAIGSYLARRAAVGGRWSPATARQTGYLLRSWGRWLDDGEWRCPDPDDVLAWATVPDSQDGRARRMSCVRTFYVRAHRWRWIDGLDVDEVFPRIAGSDGIPRPIPDRVFRSALAAAQPSDRQALTLGRYAGLRAGEIAAVHSDHLDGEWLWVRGKGGRERWVAAHQNVRSIVLGAEGFVFPSHLGGHWRPGTISARLSEVLPGEWTAHSLRHAFATQLYDETLDLVVVAAQLGHRSTRTTERYVRGRQSRALIAVQSWAA